MRLGKVTVVDSPCGSGKTNWAIKFINRSPSRNNKFIFITPFLSECERIIAECEHKNFIQPNTGRGRGKKLNDLLDLVKSGKNIVSTHALFSSLNSNMLQLFKQYNYTLIIDESINVVENISLYEKNDVLGEEKTNNDILTLKQNEFILRDEGGKLLWNNEKVLGKYEELKSLVESSDIFFTNDESLVWTFPKDVFIKDMFNNVYVLTYQFHNQIQRYYFEYFNIKYEMKSIDKDEELIDYNSDNDILFRKNIAKLINICNSEKLNLVGQSYRDKAGRRLYTTLSINWTKNNPDALITLNKNIQNYFKNITKSSGKDRMWTTFKMFKSNLKSPTCSEKNFVHIGSRATNEFGDRKHLCYPVNRYLNPFITKFFFKQGIKIDQDGYALSEMVQWIWRSAIRNGEKINIYIPSERMRNLLTTWLNV
jgi:hypothetical protein